MKTSFETARYVVSNGHQLEWVRVRCPSPRGLLFVPPLIGGHFFQQVRDFRWLIRKGYDLFSFNYSGHGGSSDKFSLRATMRDTGHMLLRASRLSDSEGLPLLGIASCYSAIPALHGAHHLAEPMEKLVLINAIPALGPCAVVRSFISYYTKALCADKALAGAGAAVRYYTDWLFPGIGKGKDYFGVLERSRASLLKTISEFFTLNPLKGVRLANTPVLCLYGRQDRILEIYDTGVNGSYREDLRRLCPRACFRVLDTDHFFSVPTARGEAARSIASFFGGHRAATGIPGTAVK